MGLQPSTISTCASSGSPLAHLLSSIGTSIGLSRFLCEWSNSTTWARQSNPILEQECSSVCSWEPVRCWLSVTLARLISSTLGRDSSSAWAAGHTSCSRSLQVKLARNQLLGWPRQDCLRHHEVHRDDRLVYLPTWLLLRIPAVRS